MLSERFSRFIRRVETPPSADTMKDWKDVQRVNAAAARLAPALYVAVSEVVYGCEQTSWVALHQAVRQQWILRAERAIRSVR